MALSDYELTYTKDWTNPEDFPTHENREDQVRADMQLLFDEMKEAFNRFLAGLEAGLVPFASSDSIPETNIQAAIENVQQQAAAAVAGEIPSRSVDGNKLKLKAVTGLEIDDEAVDTAQLKEKSVTNTILADDAVRASHVKDGELTLAKFAPNALDSKADLVNGILARSQRRWRVSLNPASSGTYTLSVNDAETVLDFNNSLAVTVGVPDNASVAIPVGSMVFINRRGAADITVTPAAGVNLNYPPNGSGTLVLSKIGSVLVLVKTANDTWHAVVLLGPLDDGDVTNAKLAADAVEARNIKAGEVVDGKLAANSVNEANIKSGAVSVLLTATIPAEIEGESAWSAQGSPFAQEVNVSGLDSSLTTTYTAHNSSQTSIVGDMTFETDDDKFSVKIDTAPTDDVIVDIAQDGGSNYSEVTIPASAWAATTAPYKQDVAVPGLLASDAPIVDIVPDATFATAEAQLEAYGAIYRMVAGADTLTVYATEETATAIPIQIKAVRK